MALHYGKLKDVIYYICEKASDNPDQLDPIKMNKILWYSDTDRYVKTGASITGERYIKKPFGPVARRNRIAVDSLRDSRILMQGRSADNGYWNDHFDLTGEISRDDLNLSKDETDLIDRVFEVVVNQNSSFGISERSHGEIWSLAANGEDLPLHTVFAECIGEVTPRHMEIASEGLTPKGNPP